MKKEILMLVIGILIGAIIATGVFLVLKGDDRGQMMDRGEPPTAMDGNSVDGGGRMRDRTNSENSVEQNETTSANESNS